ncbi:MAG: hypothetical protein SF182_01655 [Deltaproteobacteria bacterium]|nr:hypothetical protein [Deltaproteobacteria bacterium]
MSERISKLRARAFVLTSANTWYRIDLDPGVSRLKLQPRGTNDILVRFEVPPGTAPAAAPATTDADLATARAWTLAGDPGQLIEEELTGTGPRTIYAASGSAGAILEVLLGN